MRAGKIPEPVLKRSVFRYTTTYTDEILRQIAGLGNDCAEIGVQDAESVAFSVDTLFLKGYTVRQNGISRTVNNLAAAGMQPVAVLADILLPTKTEEEQLKMLMHQLRQFTESYGMAIVGGNTLVLEEVTQPVVTLTGIGKRMRIAGTQDTRQQDVGITKTEYRNSGKIRPGKVYPGMDLVVSKWIALEGSVLLLEEAAERLHTQFAAPFLEEAQKFATHLSVLEEAAAAMKSGVEAMHDVSEGGIFGALWEMAEGSGVGLNIDLKKIPLRQETVEICEALGVNPYGLLSGGCLLMAAEDGNRLAADLQAEGITATVIGKATGKKARILYNDGETRYLERPQQDEWYRFLEKKNRRENNA